MHPAQIKAAIQMRGYTQAQIATECRVEANTVSAVVHGRSRSRRIEQRIAAVTGLPLPMLWPAWHDPQAQRARRRPMSATAVADAIRALG